MTVREAITQGKADLKFAGIDTPDLDASLLLAHVLKTTRTSLIAMGTELLTEKTCEEFCALIERRCYGECVAYIIGKKEFRGLEFEVNPSVLVPRPDTETLVETALSISSEQLSSLQKYNVLDLCTGSGAVAVSLKHENPELEVYATDICAGALDTAKLNAAKLLPPESKIHFFQGDLFDALPTHCSFDLIVSNPPYICPDEIQTLSAEVQNEPRVALDGGDLGLEIIKRIIDGAPDYLKCGGTLLLEADPRQMKVLEKLLERKDFCDIKLFKDLSGSQRVIGGRHEKC